MALIIQPCLDRAENAEANKMYETDTFTSKDKLRCRSNMHRDYNLITGWWWVSSLEEVNLFPRLI